jgi:hypothetical protein
MSLYDVASLSNTPSLSTAVPPCIVFPEANQDRNKNGGTKSLGSSHIPG